MSIWDCDKPLDAMMLSHDHIAMLVIKHEKEIQELKRLVTPMMQFNPEKLTAKCAVNELRRLHQCLRNVYEVWAGSEGIPAPTVASEAYLLSLVEQMRDAAKEGLI